MLKEREKFRAVVLIFSKINKNSVSGKEFQGGRNPRQVIPVRSHIVRQSATVKTGEACAIRICRNPVPDWAIAMLHGIECCFLV
jgi:hypothetical protein